VNTSLDQSAQELIAKKLKSIKLEASRLKAKRIAEQRFLCRKISKKVKGIVKQYPKL